MQETEDAHIINIIQSPDFILPWLDRFYESDEINLLLNCLPTYETDIIFREHHHLNSTACERLFQRGIFKKRAAGAVVPADFHSRYDIWALFEGFKDIPENIRTKLNQWEFDAYVRRNRNDIETIRRTGKLDPYKKQPRYLLLNEAFEILAQAEHIYQWPCNCRSMMQRCNKPVYNCIRFDNSQGQGYEISGERAAEIIRQANKKGLVQSGELALNEKGKLSGAICNCCTDCCFPHLMAQELNAQKIWPQSRWVAQWIQSSCSFCGRCAIRCPFDAFRYDKSIDNKHERLAYEQSSCRGCGLCEVTCPEKAIEMKKTAPISLETVSNISVTKEKI